MIEGNTTRWTVTVEELMRVMRRPKLPGLEEALLEAADYLEEAVAARIDDRGEIPASSARLPDEHPVAVPIQTALKAALFPAVGETGVGPTELARRLGCTKTRFRKLATSGA